MTESVDRMLPLYEAKMIHHYDHRWATYEPDGTVRDVTLEEKQDDHFSAVPRYWVSDSLMAERLGARSEGDWLLGWRDICRSTDERTMIASRFPVAAVGHTMPIALAGHQRLLQAVWSSFVFDFVARQKVGGTHMTYAYLEQLATPRPDLETAWLHDGSSWWSSRVDWLQSARSWRSDRRMRVRTEIDAALFHVFGVERGDVDYIMETFPIVKRKDIAAHGEYRTKRLILEIYDDMAQAIADDAAYVSRFEPQEEEER